MFLESCADIGYHFEEVVEACNNESVCIRLQELGCLVACEYRNLELVKFFIEHRRVNPHATDEHGRNGLWRAAEYEQHAILSYLNERDVDLDAVDDYGESAREVITQVAAIREKNVELKKTEQMRNP